MNSIESSMAEELREAMPLLALRGLSTHLGSEREPVRAVDDVSLEIHRGETFVLLGESGCGKSMIALSVAMCCWTGTPCATCQKSRCAMSAAAV